MKRIPFYDNHQDNTHCALAVYRMLFGYFLNRKTTWEEMEKMSGFESGKAAWTVTMWERMSKQGFDIHVIEAFDYAKYAAVGESYLRTYFTEEEYDWYLKTSNILEIRPLIAPFLKEAKVDKRHPTLEDIDTFLDEGRLVFMTLNAKSLNDSDGFNAHAVLVIGKENDHYVMHDPGLPPHPNRHVSREKLWEAMGGDGSTSEVTGIKFKPRKMRADVILANMYPAYSRAVLAKLFDKGLVHYGDRELKAGDKLPSNTVVEADLSSLTISDAHIDLPILYENDDIVVVNKPAGVLTHSQGAYNPEPTVATFLRARTAALTGERAGIVHRLDRPTSGVMIGAKNPRAMAFLQKQFADRTVQKTYIAIIKGHLDEKEAMIDMAIERNPKAPATFRVGPNGKTAQTRYKVLRENDDSSLVELRPETGRTHQLRVHLAQIGHPIIGDPLYGKGKHGDRLYLHAQNLQIVLPHEDEDDENESDSPQTFTAPLPPEFEVFMGI